MKLFSDRLIKTLAKEVSDLVLSGTPIEDAIKQVWLKHNIPAVLYATARAKSMEIIRKTLGAELVRTGIDAGKAWDKLVGSSKLVQEQIAMASARGRYDVANEVKKAQKAVEAVRTTAVRLEAQYNGSFASLRKGIKEISQFGGTEKELAKLKAIVTSGVKGAPLKAAYRGVINAVTDGTQKELQKRIDIAVMQKTRYNVERVVNTERARSVFAAERENIANDPDIHFVKFVLAGGHDPDECDAYANADMGYGKGIYPIDQAPVLPIHPNGKSRLLGTYGIKAKSKVIPAETALEIAGEKKGVKINNVQFEPITKKL